MSGSEKFWLILWSVIVVSVATMVISCQHIYTRHVEKMAQLGYEEEVLPGHHELAWRQVKNNE